MHEGMEYVFGCFISHVIETRYSTMGALSNSNFSHTLPIPCNNYLNQILAEINRWVKRQEKGQLIVFMGFTQWLKVKHSPSSLSLGNNAPISLFVALT